MSLKNSKKKSDKNRAVGTKDPKHKQKSGDGESSKPVTKSKHIVFDDSDEEGNVANGAVAKSQPPSSAQSKHQKHRKDGSDIGKLWYQLVSHDLLIIIYDLVNVNRTPIPSSVRLLFDLLYSMPNIIQAAKWKI